MFIKGRENYVLSVIYFLLGSLFVLCFWENHNLLDLLYFGVLTLFYFRIRVYRFKKYH